ncbi:SHOCT domain-containing protein [Microbacterium awajiense]|uniref:SHOCT domain-containing protein n=1 Tax=Microbacterium awajiense TaxID=415214 RepID=A0ABP7AAN7_9MICO
MRFIEAVTTSASPGFWGSFWDIIWWFLWIFVFVAYLMVLFSIIGDLFRDHKLSGWWKALWILFLIFVPFLTALIYLIARGRGMAERGAAEAAQMKSAQDAYIKQVAGASPSEEIAKAKALLDAGTITQAEYDAIKAKALA